jgi:predicted secreted protein
MQPPAGQFPAKPNNYLVWSILVTLFCCLPFGIAAIVYSSKVDSLWASGQYQASEAAAASAKKWILWSVISAVVIAVLYFVLVVVLGIASSNN